LKDCSYDFLFLVLPLCFVFCCKSKKDKTAKIKKIVHAAAFMLHETIFECFVNILKY